MTSDAPSRLPEDEELEPDDGPRPGRAVLDALGPLSDREAMRAAPRLLRERNWVLAVLGLIVLSVAFALLGRWQLHRYQGKLENRTIVTTNYDAAPLPLSQVIAPGRPLPHRLLWRQVEMHGRYLSADTTLIRNRPINIDQLLYGYEVVVPLRLDDGSVVLVDRGWIPNGQTGAAPAAVPAPPGGEVDVIARLQPTEGHETRQAPPGQLNRIDVQALNARLSGPTYPWYAMLAAETPSARVNPTQLPRPDVGLGPHLGYAWQWWAFGVVAWVLLAVAASREMRRRLDGRPERDPRPVPR